MPCEPIVEDGKVTGFVCSRKGPKPKCYKCGKPATRLCDYRGGYKYHKGYQDKDGRVHMAYETANMGTCDKPMCAECAKNYGELDYCDEHNNEFCIHQTKLADRAFDKMLENADKMIKNRRGAR